MGANDRPATGLAVRDLATAGLRSRIHGSGNRRAITQGAGKLTQRKPRQPDARRTCPPGPHIQEQTRQVLVCRSITRQLHPPQLPAELTTEYCTSPRSTLPPRRALPRSQNALDRDISRLESRTGTACPAQRVKKWCNMRVARPNAKYDFRLTYTPPASTARRSRCCNPSAHPSTRSARSARQCPTPAPRWI